MSKPWLNSFLEKASPVKERVQLEKILADELIKNVYNFDLSSYGEKQEVERRKLLASAFDLLIAAEYYRGVSHSGWIYCPDKTPYLFYPYTNCCPRCVLKNVFVFHESNKLESGSIGSSTSRLLCIFLKSIFEYKKKEIEVLKSVEPVDVIIRDKKNKYVFLAEIKASPLVTPPLCATSQRLTEETAGTSVERGHSSSDNSHLYGSEIHLMIPAKKNDKWVTKYFNIGIRANLKDEDWAYRGMLELLKNDKNFFGEFYSFWKEAFSYCYPKKQQDIFWLTNACGAPYPIPSDWPGRRRGGGFETISDSKTSVGLDRTDDIKKGIYQVLKIGSEAKPITSDWALKVGLISNIHPVRHFSEYLASLKDIVWTSYPKPVRKAGDLPSEKDIYNLFDGIISLTDTIVRDDWVKQTFKF